MAILVDKIELDRLVLRKFRPSDLDAFIEFRSHPDIYKYMISAPKNSREEYESSLMDIVNGYKRVNPIIKWAIELKSEHKVIGSVSIEHVYPKHDRCELGWSLNVSYQGHGYASEALKGLIDYIFTHTNMHRIHAFIWQGNDASCKLAERLGFQYEGTNIEARKKDDKYIDVLNYGLTRSMWEQK